MLRFFSVSTSSWADKIELPTFDFTGGRALNGGRGGSATFHVRDPWVSEVVTDTSIAHLERMLVAEEDGNAVYAGIIYDVVEDLDAGTVVVSHFDAAWWIMARRYVLNVRGSGAPAGAPLTLTSKTLATIAFRLVANGMDGDPAGRYELPLIMNADVAGSHSRTYEGFKFITVEDALQEVIKTDGGPFVDFDTQWDNATETFRWVMRAGDLTQGLWEWDATAIKTEVFGPKLRTNAEKVANRVIGTGEGSGEDMIARSDESFAGSSFPALERVSSYQDIHDGVQLQDRTTADLNAANELTKQFTFKIPVGGTVKLGDLILGGTCRVKTSGFRFLDAGWHDWRLIQWDFDRDWITMQMQEIGG
jgi:hypothetical protein